MRRSRAGPIPLERKDRDSSCHGHPQQHPPCLPDRTLIALIHPTLSPASIFANRAEPISRCLARTALSVLPTVGELSCRGSNRRVVCGHRLKIHLHSSRTHHFSGGVG